MRTPVDEHRLLACFFFLLPFRFRCFFSPALFSVSACFAFCLFVSLPVLVMGTRSSVPRRCAICIATALPAVRHCLFFCFVFFVLLLPFPVVCVWACRYLWVCLCPCLSLCVCVCVCVCWCMRVFDQQQCCLLVILYGLAFCFSSVFAIFTSSSSSSSLSSFSGSPFTLCICVRLCTLVVSPPLSFSCASCAYAQLCVGCRTVGSVCRCAECERDRHRFCRRKR